MRKPPPRRTTRSIVAASATLLRRASAAPRARRGGRGGWRGSRGRPWRGSACGPSARRPRSSPPAPAAADSAPATTSTSSISAGGLKKCMPTTRSGRGGSAAIAVTGSEEVLVASTRLGPQTAASAANSSRFSSRFSGAASITSSQSARSSRLARGADPACSPRRRRPRSSALARRPWSAPARSRSMPRLERRRRPGRAGASRSRRAPRPGRSRRPSSRRRRRRPARRSSHSALELRLALLEERPHPLDPVLGRHRQLVEPALVVEAGGEAVSSAASTACLASRTAIGGARRPPGELDRLLEPRPCAATWLTKPSRSASSASMRRPVSTSSIARCLPITRASRWVPPPPGMIPSVISGWPNSAVSEATIMSQASASSQPPPSAKPETAAISGVLQRRDPLPEAAPSGGAAPPRSCARHRLDVGAGGEHLVAAGDHDAADLAVGVELLELARELLHQLGRERVARLGAVEPQQSDVAVDASSRPARPRATRPPSESSR